MHREKHTHAIGTIHSAGDGEETPTGEEDVEEESERREEDGCRRKTGKNSRFLEVDDDREIQSAPFTGDFQANEWELTVGETSTLIAHGKREGLDMEKAVVSTPQLLGFATPLDMEKSAGTAPQLLGFAAPLDMEKAAVLAPQLLGLAAPLEPPEIDETEQPRGREVRNYAETEKSPDEDVTSLESLETDERSTGFAEVGDEGLLRKESILIDSDGDLERGPPLGFSGTNPSTGCGGVRIPPFNLQEFLRLAYTIIDEGDEVSREASNELKNKWETHFGPEPIPKVFPASMAVRTELRKPTRHVWRSLIPSRALERTSALGSALCNATPGENLSVTRFSDDHSDRILTETMGRNAGPLFGNFPIDLKEFRPMNTENGVRPARTQQSPDSAEMEHDAAADIIVDLSHDTIDDITADLEHDTTADAVTDLCNDAGNDTGADATADVLHDISNGLFVGNIPLNATLNVDVDDKIADAFNNSSRRTLSYIPPTIQNGEVVVRPTIADIRNGSTKWKTTAVGYFLGKRPHFYHVKDFAFSTWPGLREKWEPGMVMRKLKHTQVPVWIKSRHLPVELWTEAGLSTGASGIGKPLYPDAITRACTRLDFARVCVMLDVSSKLHKHIIIMTPDEDGGETPCKIDVEYEWIPPKCTSCMTLGHAAKDCALNKPSKPIKPPVTVYVPKTGLGRLPPVHDQEIIPPARGVDKQRDRRESPSGGAVRSSREDKGKELVVYNTFDALHLLDDADEMSRGPNHSSPICGDPC
ncbi:UNVERIFIED_CONTAM: hypothetical protein Sindi_0921500 [Sesamum indicum]